MKGQSSCYFIGSCFGARIFLQIPLRQANKNDLGKKYWEAISLSHLIFIDEAIEI